MTIINCLVCPDQVLIGTDSEGIFPGGVRRMLTKVFQLPHANAVLTGRGSTTFIGAMFLALNQAGETFDEMLRVLPDCWREAEGLLQKMAPNDHTLQSGHELLLAGWSDARHSLSAELVWSYGLGQLVQSRPVVWTFAAPWDADALGKLDIKPTPEDMFDMARRQMTLIRSRHPEDAAGGRFVLTRVRRDSVHLERLGLL